MYEFIDLDFFDFWEFSQYLTPQCETINETTYAKTRLVCTSASNFGNIKIPCVLIDFIHNDSLKHIS